MNKLLCQNCGAMLRSSSKSCSGCGNLVTKYSATGFAYLNSLPPGTVALKEAPIQAEKMMVALQHADSFEQNSAVLSAATSTTASAVLSPSVLTYVSELGRYLDYEPAAEPGASPDPSSDPSLDLRTEKQAGSLRSLTFSKEEPGPDPNLDLSMDPGPDPNEVLTKKELQSGSAGFQPASENPETNIPGLLAAGTAGAALGAAAAIAVTKALSDRKVQAVESNSVSIAMQESPCPAPATRSNEQTLPDQSQAVLTQVSESGSTKPESRDFFADAKAKPFRIEPFDDYHVHEDSPSAIPLSFLVPAKTESTDTRNAVTTQAFADDKAQTAALMQRLVDAQMNASLPAESTFFDQVETPPVPKKRSFKRDKSVGEQEKIRHGKPVRKADPSPSIKPYLILIASLAISGLLAFYLGFNALPKQAITAADSVLSVSGKYSYWYQDLQGRQSQGTMALRQEGEQISGEGKDFLRRGNSNVYDKKSFLVKGVAQKQQIKLLKKYLNQNNQLVYEGQLFIKDKAKELEGQWYFDPATVPVQPGLNPKHFWHASYLGAVTQESNWFKDTFWNDNEPASQKFMKILGGCIIFGLLIVHVSLKFFGMHGLLNLQEREKYITVSARPKHLKMMHEMAKAKGKGSLFIGERADWNFMEFFRPKKLYYPASWRERNPHFLALGAGAKGKTRLLANLAMNDIKNEDRAVVIVDSEGSLIELILRCLATEADAKELLDRVSLIDPCRNECNLGFNPLSPDNAENLQGLANSIVMGFKAVYTESQNQQNQWTQQTANILRNAVLLLALNDKSLDALPTLLSDNDFRDVLLEKVEKNYASEWKTLIEAWSNYKRLARSEQWLNWIEPILNRVQPLLSDQRIARLLNVKNSSVNLSEVLEEKRILLVRVPEGQLDKGGDLLGSLIITGLKQSALMHFERTGEAGTPCALYVDELNNFMDADAFESICSDLRKVQIGIHGSLKTLQELPEDYRNKVQNLLGSMAIFSISKKDADTLGPSVFKVDGAKMTKVNLKDVVNPVNSMPNLRMASEEEKINISRLVGQDERCYFFHVVGSEAGIFRMKAPEFRDIARGDVNWDLLDSVYEQADFEDEA